MATVYYEPTVQANNLALSNIHTLTTWVAGAAAGILGLKGYAGFVFFAMSWLLITALISGVRCEGQPSKYFKGGLREIAAGSLFNSLLSYILIWTLIYAVVHVYD
ncbi:hypothetical protein EV182_001822 [Spiromyces aspiralis]|uniref:Uncharacterized protein n=1 Tax=Spiromyces aspiralis TaxID=68401 RepID=A0ACC1HYQ2_9FUNG|nr:hypothetical protein EV182_001822 [Spiromyces aspiralis]